MRAMLPAALRRTIDDGRSRVVEVRVADEVRDADEASMEALTALDGAADALLMAYDEAIALVPRLRECPLDVIDPPKPAQPPPWLIEENRQRSFRMRFEQRVHEISEEAYVV